MIMDYTKFIGCEVQYETLSGIVVNTTMNKARAELLNENTIKIRKSTFRAFLEARFLDASILEKALGKKARKCKGYILLSDKSRVSLTEEIEVTDIL